MAPRRGSTSTRADVFAEITDDLLYHGDLDAALRRLLQEGFRDRDGSQIEGFRELMEDVRARRRDLLEQHELGGVYDDIAGELARWSTPSAPRIEELLAEARESGDARRQELTNQTVDEHRMELDLLSPDLAGMVRELGEYDFTSADASERFEELMDKCAVS